MVSSHFSFFPMLANGLESLSEYEKQASISHSVVSVRTASAHYIIQKDSIGGRGSFGFFLVPRYANFAGCRCRGFEKYGSERERTVRKRLCLPMLRATFLRVVIDAMGANHLPFGNRLSAAYAKVGAGEPCSGDFHRRDLQTFALPTPFFGGARMTRNAPCRRYCRNEKGNRDAKQNAQNKIQ